MPEWDVLENFISSMGYFTIYSPGYDDELKDTVIPFDCREIDFYADLIAGSYEESLDYTIEHKQEEEYDLIGINSNSFTSDKDHHNIFMEWDNNHSFPNIDNLKKLGGTIVKTDGGLHFFKNTDLPWEAVKGYHSLFNCCPGFSSYSDRRKYACLRVCPKGDNHLKIIQAENSFLHEVYEKVVKKLEEVHNGMVG